MPLNAGRAEAIGMFIDEGRDGILIRGNAIWRIERSPLRFHRAAHNRVEENVLVVANEETPPLRYNNTNSETIAERDNAVIAARAFAPERVRAVLEEAGPRVRLPDP